MSSAPSSKSPDDSIEIEKKDTPKQSDREGLTPARFSFARAHSDSWRRWAGSLIIAFYAVISTWITWVIVKKINRLFEVSQKLLDGSSIETLPNQLVGFVSIIVASQTVLTLTLIIWSGRMMRAAFELLTPYRDLANAKDRSAVDDTDGGLILSSVENIVRSVERILKRNSGG